MGIGKFQPPTKSIGLPLNRSTKKIGTVDYIHEGTSYTKFTDKLKISLLYIHLLRTSEQMGDYNKNYFYLFIYTFFSLRGLEVRAAGGFLCTIAQKTQGCAFLGL